MNLTEKMAYAKQHVESILRHDDEPIEDRAQAAAALKQHIDAELSAAQKRETPKLIERRVAFKAVVAANAALDAAKKKARELTKGNA